MMLMVVYCSIVGYFNFFSAKGGLRMWAGLFLMVMLDVNIWLWALQL